jgi:3',5'-cyclic AMP phosphodiesterase CpdA
MPLIIQISDPHFGTEQQPVVEALVRLVHEHSPDLVIMSGDITQRAKARQFHAAKQFLDSLRAPASLAIPGNHDIPLFDIASRLFRPYAKFQREFGSNLEPVYEDGAMLVITVNTTRRYRHIDGEISPAQIERVAALLDNARPNQLRIVVTHQPVCVVRPEDEHNLLHGHNAAIRAWSSAGADAIMGGHIHRPFVCPLSEPSRNHEVNLGTSPRSGWAIQAGTAVSSRVRYDAGNSVNLIHYDPAQMDTFKVERWDYHRDKNAFDIVAVHDLKRG